MIFEVVVHVRENPAFAEALENPSLSIKKGAYPILFWGLLAAAFEIVFAVVLSKLATHAWLLVVVRLQTYQV